MSDSPLEEMEHREDAERAEEAARGLNPLVSQVTLTIAVLAVAAAVSASLETSESDAAISAKNDAMLAQDRATDQWSFANSKSLRKKVYEIAVDQGAPKTLDYKSRIAHENADELDASGKARSLEADSARDLDRAESHEARHGRLTVGSTLLHMAIAIATLAIILTRRWPWLAAIGLAVAGVIVDVWAYL
jgi:hypothetical protein